MIADPRSQVLVVPGADGLMACCQIRDLGDELAYFGTFAVDPARQGRRLGRMVMAEAKRQACRVFGAAAMEMSVLAQQEKLIAWYERLGFARTGETRPFPADARHAQPKRADLHFVVLRASLDPTSEQ